MSYSGSIIDIHAHVQPAAVISDRRLFVGSEPDFRLLYENPKYRLSSSEDVLLYMKRDGISSAVILGFAWRDEKLLKSHNDMILSDARKSDGKLTAFTCIYPFSGSSEAEARRCFKAGAAGLGEIGLYDRDLDQEYIDAMSPVMKVCLEYGRPVMLHVNEPIGHSYSGKAPMSLRGIYSFLKQYPDNRIILSHWGGGILFFNALKKEAKEVLKNVWYDSAASPYLYDKSIWKKAVESVGEEKILFGTDFPLLEASRYISELSESGLSDDILKKILFENAWNLLHN